MTLVIGLASIVAGCANATETATTSDLMPAGAVIGVVTWIDDGDTIEVVLTDEVTEVRLVSMNAPDQGECFADRALNHLIETLRDRTIRLVTFGEDQFGRTLAHVFADDRHVNLELVEMGMAIAATPEGNDPYRKAMLKAEDDAYVSGFGLWAASACGTDDPLPNVVIVPGQSVIDPDGPDDQNLAQESLRLRNEGSESIDLTGWIVRDESTRHRFTFGELTLEPDETVTVPSSDPGWDPGGGPVWNNDGDMAMLQLPDGTVVSRWRY